MRLSGVGVATVLALALMNSADATPVPPGAVALKAAADNPVTQVQWVGWGNGSQARRYRWHLFSIKGVGPATARPMATRTGAITIMVRAARLTPRFRGGLT
jgi:hypothetical protein